jgi:hypothetical protein
MEEATKKAELLSNIAASDQKRALEQKKVSLKLEEEELNIKTEMAVCDAKTKVLEQFEQEEWGSQEHEQEDIQFEDKAGGAMVI